MFLIYFPRALFIFETIVTISSPLFISFYLHLLESKTMFFSSVLWKKRFGFDVEICLKIEIPYGNILNNFPSRSLLVDFNIQTQEADEE